MTTYNVDGEIVYSDVNVDLGTTSQYELLYNEDAIRRSLLNILLTVKGSRPFRRSFGSNLMALLFDPLDVVTAKRIRTQLMTDIVRHEPRIILDDVEVIPDYSNDCYYVNVVGRMLRLDNKSLSLNFNLKRKVS